MNRGRNRVFNGVVYPYITDIYVDEALDYIPFEYWEMYIKYYHNGDRAAALTAQKEYVAEKERAEFWKLQGNILGSMVR